MGSRGFHSNWRKIFPWFLVVLFVFFFVGGPDYHSARHLKAFWNLGHILFFALLAYLLFSYRKWLEGRFAAQSLIILGICLALGILIELFQYDFQRTPDIGDVFRDMIGGLVGIFFFLCSRKSLRAKVLAAFQVVVIGLVGLQVYPVLTALADEYLARRQFPVLSGFETPWEIARWEGNAVFAVDCSVHREGKCSLRVQLGTERYSGISLFYFQHNWEGARSFRFSVFNPSQQMLSLTCRIHDLQHENGEQSFADRFNRQYEVPAGWTTIDIDVQDIRNAPKGRKMDMGHIVGVGIFAMNLPQPRVVYIDDVRLVY
jgi:VanZ family protein